MADDDATRFDKVQRTAAYQVALYEEAPPPVMRWTSLVAMTAIMAGLVAALAVMKPFAAIVAGATTGLLLAVTIASMLRDKRAPIERRLGIVASTWAGLRGGSQEVQRVARSIALRDAFGIEREYRMSPAVVGDALDGSIGLATIRRGTVIRFVNLDG